MNSPIADHTSTAAELEGTLAVLEANLMGLSDSLRDHDAAAMERQAEQLHQALATAVHRFAQAARSGASVPPALRLRLARAGSQVAAQREALARATAALDRAIDVLLPGLNTGSVYGTSGSADRPGRSGMVQA
ncbi:hypothetical protein [Azohydromonas caseinilytica]|uniref:FlgN protein n=1 Tax=Azohydromonas caseinilytica TaxID=2728836 RepID=A0A848F9I8_9BURK|nr:hypothetical protein [Azohydromonas caseinilytica]NML14900.1 hypothetical protein [Azohydromonas caseinilytica]